MARRRATTIQKGKDEDVRLMAALAAVGVISIVLFSVFIISPPATIGPNEGELAPDFVASAYNGGGWDEFRLTDQFDREWTAGEDGKFILIQFMDSDCPHCWREAETMSELHSQWGGKVTFISIAVELSIQGHSSDRDEIKAFRDKTNYGTDSNDGNGCNSGGSNCVERPGTAHAWNYVDDYNSNIIRDYGVTGTPFMVLLQPDGYVAWNQGQSGGLMNIEQALQIYVEGN